MIEDHHRPRLAARVAVIDADRNVAGGSGNRAIFDLRDVAARNVRELTHHPEHLARAFGRQLLHLRPFLRVQERSEEHTSELQSLMRISYAVFCLHKNTTTSLT